MLHYKSLLLAVSLSTLVGCGGGGGSSSNQGASGRTLELITPILNSESYTIPAMANLPSFTIVEETGFDGDIDENLSLTNGISSIVAVDIQRDLGISLVCTEGDNKPAILTEADYTTNKVTETAYIDSRVAASCNSTYQSILPVTITRFNITDVLEDWGTENPTSTTCPTATTVTPPVTPPTPTNLCSSISLVNYLITDTNGKEHKISLRTTTDLNN